MESQANKIHEESASDSELIELPPAKRTKFQDKIDPVALEAKFHVWKELLYMTDADYRKHTLYTPTLHLCDVLGLGKDQVFSSTNVSLKMTTLRYIFARNPWVECSPMALTTLVREGRIRCLVCRGVNNKVGFGLCRKAFADSHVHHGSRSTVEADAEAAAKGAITKGIPLHRAVERVQQTGPQASLFQAGFQTMGERAPRKTAKPMPTGRPVAGGRVAAGSAPSSVSIIPDKTFRTLLNADSMRTPSSTFVLEAHVPAAVSILKAHVTKILEGMPVSFGVDCRSSGLFSGVNICVVEIFSPVLPYTILGGSKFYFEHKTGDAQAEILEHIRETYKIEKRNIHFLSSDNASVDAKTVDALNRDFGWSVGYARSLPHCLNLVLQNFLESVDRRYRIKSFLRTVRSFLKADCALSRKSFQYSLPLSFLDFADTRWDSFCECICSLMSLQSDTDLSNALYLLAARAARGDAGAKAALDDTPEKQLRFIALGECLEEIFQNLSTAPHFRDQLYENHLASKSSEPAFTKAETIVQNLLDYMSDAGNVAALTALNAILKSFPTVFQVLQISAQHEGTTSAGASDSTTASLAVSELSWSLQMLKDGSTELDLLLAEVRQQSALLREQIVASEVTLGMVSEDTLAANGKSNDISLNDAIATLKLALKEASTAVEMCAGLQKLTDSLSALKVTESFLRSSSFPVYPPGSDILKEFLIPNDQRILELAQTLRKEMTLYSQDPVAPEATLQSSIRYWMTEAARKHFPILSDVAIKFLARPASNAGVEQCFSLLSKLSGPKRRQMRLETLERLFFLQCNSHVDDILCPALAERLDNAAREIATNIVSSSRRAEEEERTRRQDLDRALAMSLAATEEPSAESIIKLWRAATEALPMGAGASEEDGEEGEEESEEEEVAFWKVAADCLSDEAEL